VRCGAIKRIPLIIEGTKKSLEFPLIRANLRGYLSGRIRIIPADTKMTMSLGRRLDKRWGDTGEAGASLLGD